MLFIIITLYLFQGFFNVDAAPLSVILQRQIGTNPVAPQECICPDTRSRWDIVQSCLATIFVCTWLSVHPNIPALGQPWWKKACRRLELMFWSIIAPELIIFWAARQWAEARKLATKYKEHGWTLSHGYFIQMGGFMLYDEGNPIGVLSPDELERLVKEGEVLVPPTTEEEIQDRSKSDGLSKALIVVQTTWFICQCIARRAQGLITTELELTTLAFATLNGIMYMLWWFKPLDVQTTVRVNLLPFSTQKVPVDPVIVQNDDSHIPEEFSSIELELTPTADSITKIGRNNGTGGSIATEIEPENSIPSESSEMRSYQGMKKAKLQDLGSLVWWLISGVLFRWPVAAMKTFIWRIGEAGGVDTISKDAMHVPTFYASYNGSGSREVFAVVNSLPFVGILFGAIHCAGWGFSFPSLIEANVWRVSSAIITSVPAVFLVGEIYTSLPHHFRDNFSVPKSLENNCLVKNILDLFESLMIILIVGAALIYIMARLALLVVALTTLRDLPPEALAAVNWISFLPHI